jgi:glycerol uptake facilitator-like aquaporin
VNLAARVFGVISSRELLVYVPAQVAGACLGVIVANVMFDLDAVALSTQARSGSGILLGEAVATFGLVLVIVGVVRSGRAATAPFAVAGYIAAAYWFTSSTSFANPAVTIGRTLTDTFAGIAPSSAPMFVVMELLGGFLAIVLTAYLHPDSPPFDLVVPHDHAAA